MIQINKMKQQNQTILAQRIIRSIELMLYWLMYVDLESTIICYNTAAMLICVFKWLVNDVQKKL